MAERVDSDDRLRAGLVVLATVGVVFFNFMASAGYFNGVPPEVVSGRYPTVMTPAGYAFSIWGLIYVGLAAFSVFQLRGANAARFRGVRSLYVVSCVLNCAWIYAFHYDQIGVCLVLILMLAGTLLLINIRFRGCRTTAETWLMQAPFGIYFGWVTAAALVNLMVFFRYIDSPVGSSTTVASAMILFASGCAVVVRSTLRNFFYPLAIGWAVTAIAIKQSGSTSIVVSAAIGLVICLVTTGSFVSVLRSAER